MNTHLNGLEWLGLVASFATLVSFIVNVFQYLLTVNLVKVLHSKVFAMWNEMFRVAELADQARATFDNAQLPEARRLELIIRAFEQVTGISDTTRQELLAFSEKYLRKPMKRQHPAFPDKDKGVILSLIDNLRGRKKV